MSEDISGLRIHELFVSEKFASENRAILEGTGYDILETAWIEKASTLVRNDDGIATVMMPSHTEFIENPKSWTLVLDSISDPGNLGTMLRIADWYGISRIICSKNTVDVYNPKVIMASMGSFMRVRVSYEDLPSLLKKTKLPVYGAFLGGENIHHADLGTPGYLVIGNESHGISTEVASLVSRKITIPKIGGAESLNAAIASAIVLDNIFRCA